MLDSVQFINFQYDDDVHAKDKGVAWVLAALNTPDDLRTAFLTIFGDFDVLKLYNSEDSYLWKDRKQLLDICGVLKEKDMFIDCDLLNQFKKWQEEKQG